MKTIAIAAALTIGLTAAALAQEMDHSSMGHSTAPTDAAASPSTAAFEAANAQMHSGMAVELTGDADLDFARSMIPHHQGAIAMAEIMLEHGEDPELRALAEEIVAAQEAEIAVLNRWLEANGPAAGAPAQ